MIRGPIIRARHLVALLGPLLLASACGGCRPSVPILTWHDVGESVASSSADKSFRVGAQQLAAQLDALRTAGRHAIPLHDWLDHEDHGAALPAHPVVLTFDDGTEDGYSLVLPLLRERQMRATFFIVSGLIADTPETRKADPADPRRRYLIWPEVKALAAAGMEIGSHSQTHARLTGLNEQQARAELTQSKAELERHLGSPVESFAWPYNAVRPALARMAEEAGYRAAVAGVIHGNANRYMLYRSSIDSRSTPAGVLELSTPQ